MNCRLQVLRHGDEGARDGEESDSREKPEERRGKREREIRRILCERMTDRNVSEDAEKPCEERSDERSDDDGEARTLWMPTTEFHNFRDKWKAAQRENENPQRRECRGPVRFRQK